MELIDTPADLCWQQLALLLDGKVQLLFGGVCDLVYCFIHQQLQSAGLLMKQARPFYNSGMMIKDHKFPFEYRSFPSIADWDRGRAPTLRGLFVYLRQLNYRGKRAPYDIGFNRK